LFIRILLLFTLLTTSIFAKVTLSDNSKYDNFSIEYFYDKSSSLDITDLKTQSFLKSNNSFTFGYIDGTTWFKIEIKNSSDSEDYILSFSEAIWKEFNLYRKIDTLFIEEKNGLDIPLSSRSICDVNPAFEIHIAKNSTQTFYIQGQTIASQIGRFEILSAKEYYNPSKISTVDLYSAFALILMVIVILNSYSYILTKSNAYIYYIAYTLASIVFSSMHSGSYLVLGFHGWSEGLHVVGTFVILFLLLFSDKFLNLKEELPLTHKFFIFSAGVFLLFSLLIFNNVTYSSLLFNIYSALFFLVLFFAVIKVFLNGSNAAKYYLIALLIYAPLMALMIATFNTFLPYTEFTRHSFLAGALIEIIFFTLILTSRYRTINLQKIEIQKELIFEQSKNEEFLETQILERTKEIQESKKELELLASTDSMTKLYNRRYFTEISKSLLDLAKRNKSYTTVIMLDIDKFKNVNDTYGHKVGDKVIISLASLLLKYSRKSDIVSRWGGEEFVVLLPQTNQEGAYTIAQKMRYEAENLVLKLEGNREVKFTISIGISHIDLEHDLDVEMAIHRADEALYEAKSTGRNRVCLFNDSL